MCKNSWTCPDAVWVMDSGGPKEACIRWGPGPPCEGAIIRGKTCPGIPDNTAVSCAKNGWTNWLLFGLWTLISTSSIVFRWRQCAFVGGHIGAMWRIRLNCPSVVVLRPYVKLLWPIVLVPVMHWLIYGVNCYLYWSMMFVQMIYYCKGAIVERGCAKRLPSTQFEQGGCYGLY